MAFFLKLAEPLSTLFSWPGEDVMKEQPLAFEELSRSGLKTA